MRRRRQRARAGSGLFARTAIALTLALAALAGCQTVPVPERHKPAVPQPGEPGTLPVPARATTDREDADAAGGSTSTVAPGQDLWAAIRADFRLDHEVDHPRVRAELLALRRYPNHFLRMRERLELYLPEVYEQVKSRGMPAEIALLPILESGMNPHAEALSGPAGLWQLIPATGDRMKLPRNWWFDGRRDPALSTRAALDYLDYLHTRFDDWRLAIVSYNAGEGTVTRALGDHGDPISFWALRLPHHGMVFVPKLLALAEVIAHPDRYGIALPELRTGPTYTTLATGGQVEIPRAARALNVDEETLYQLNPALNRTATPPEGPHQLHVPPALAAEASAWLASLDHTERIAATTARSGRGLPATRGQGGKGDAHVVRSGDTLWDIARTYRVPVDRLLSANGLDAGQILKIGQRLVIPPA